MKKRRRKDYEIRFYEQLLQKTPNFVRALSLLADAYTRKGFYEEGLHVDKRLVQLEPENPVVHYNLACSLSLVGNADDALCELRKAVLLGYHDVQYILQDPDLDNVRKHLHFKTFFNKLTKIKRVQSR